jgi:hypothetical protein
VAEGICTVRASIAEGTNYLAATGATQSVTVTARPKLSTSTTLASSANPATVGQQVTFTATVAPATASGTVSFTLDGAPLGTAQVGIGGRASITITASAIGTFRISADYGGNATYAGSTSVPLGQSVQSAPGSAPPPTTTPTPTPTTTPAPQPSTTTLASSANPVGAGQPVTFTARVSCSTATGTVTFADGGQALGTAPVAGGQASLAVTLQNGRHAVTAAYGGDAACAPSISAPLTQTVRGAPATVPTPAPAPAPAPQATTTTVGSSANPVGAGQPVTLTAQVSCATPATGTVTFMDGRQVLGTAPVVNGQASLSVTLAGGRYRVTAAYGGDAGCAASTSAPLALTVNKK